MDAQTHTSPTQGDATTTKSRRRWNVEVVYIAGRPHDVFGIEELEELDRIIEQGPDWRFIERIVITLADAKEHRDVLTERLRNEARRLIAHADALEKFGAEKFGKGALDSTPPTRF